MDLDDIVSHLEFLLDDSADRVKDKLGDLVAIALRDFSRYKPLTKEGVISLVADQSLYAAPTDILDIKYHSWGQKQRQAQYWEPGYPRRLPRAFVEDGEPANIRLSFAPTAGLIASLGSQFSFTYSAYRVVEGNTVPIREQDLDILLVRTMAEVMRVLANAKVNKPVSTQNVVASVPKNGTPAALSELYIKQFKEMICRA